jgi:hypothetical protein
MLPPSSGQTTEAGRSFETSLPLYKTTRNHNPEDQNAHIIFFEVNEVNI